MVQPPTGLYIRTGRCHPTFRRSKLIYVHLSEVRVACLGGVCSWRSQDGPRQVVSTPPWWHTISNNCILLLQVDVFDVVDAVYISVFVYIDFETETIIKSMNSFIYTNKYYLYILFIVMFIYDYIYKYVWIHDTIVNTQKGNCFEISFGYINPAESLSPHVDPSRQASQKNREDPFTLRHPAIEWAALIPQTSLLKAFRGFQTPTHQLFGGFGMCSVIYIFRLNLENTNYTSFENGCCSVVLVAASAICKKEMSAFFVDLLALHQGTWIVQRW